MGAIPPQWITCGRLAWAFARDVGKEISSGLRVQTDRSQNGVPFSKFFSQIDEKLEFPVRTTVAALCFACIYGLLYLVSTTAFNSIITSAVLFLNITYAVPQGILLFRGRTRTLPDRYLQLGWFGYFANAFSITWTVVMGVFICFPPTLPVKAGSMNYTSVILVGLFLVVIGLWFTIGKRFEGPHIDWEMIQEANHVSKLKHGEQAILKPLLT